MVGIVIVTHGNFAKELLAATEMIVGSLKQVEAVAIYAKEGLNDLEKKLKQAIEKTNSPEGVLILIDMFGGSPATASLSFIDKYKMKVMAGVNLPIVLEVVTHRQSCDLEKLADLALATGEKSILMADEIFRRKRDKRKSLKNTSETSD